MPRAATCVPALRNWKGRSGVLCNIHGLLCIVCRQYVAENGRVTRRYGTRRRVLCKRGYYESGYMRAGRQRFTEQARRGELMQATEAEIEAGRLTDEHL